MPDFDRYLKEQAEESMRTKETKVSSTLKESVLYSLMAPGKRIRPRLVEASASVFKLTPQQFLPAAAALEMFHCATLIHDDLPCMDDDDTRRGQPANHVRFGASFALLAGDALFMMASECFSRSFHHVPPMAWRQGHQRFLNAIGPRGVMGGQGAELSLGDQDGLEALRSVHRQKTGALFVAAVMIPAEFAGVPSTEKGYQALERFAADLGEGFQVLDDLEDLDQDRSRMKRNVFGYGSVKDVLSEFQARMQRSCEAVREEWGDSSGSLVSIASEISNKLKHLEGGAS